MSLAFPLYVFIAAGVWRLWRGHGLAGLRRLAPAFVWLLGILLVYPLLLPLKSQAGSFEKAFLTIVPLLMPPAALALQGFRRRPKH